MQSKEEILKKHLPYETDFRFTRPYHDCIYKAMEQYASQFQSPQSKDVEAKELEADMYDEAVFDVLAEVRRAKTMFKENFHNQHEGYAVILEELDELWEEVKKNQKVYDIPAQRKEAIQCGAMCVRFIAELTNKIISKTEKFKEGEIVCLKEDERKEKYTVESYANEISRGPMRQYDPSPVVLVKDTRNRLWEFREDSITKLSDNDKQISHE